MLYCSHMVFCPPSLTDRLVPALMPRWRDSSGLPDNTQASASAQHAQAAAAAVQQLTTLDMNYICCLRTGNQHGTARQCRGLSATRAEEANWMHRCVALAAYRPSGSHECNLAIWQSALHCLGYQSLTVRQRKDTGRIAVTLAAHRSSMSCALSAQSCNTL